MADVFLSYARASHRPAKLIASRLRSSGFSVWFDEELPAHRTYSDVIEEQLEAAKAVVVLWSGEAVRSQWVRSEANRARETGRLVQVRLDDARLPMPFDQIQCADLRRWPGRQERSAWSSMLASVGTLVSGDDREPPLRGDSAAKRFGRRELLLGGGAAAGAVLAVAGGFVLWRSAETPELSPEAQLLFQKGVEALQTNDAFDPTDPASAAQAIAFLTDATRLAPESASAWGALAMAYAVRTKMVPPPERAGFGTRTRSAAQRALSLDSSEPLAVGALGLLHPVYRNWAAAERAHREALKVHPRLPLLLFLLADVLGSVGRWGEAAALSRKFDRTKFLIAGADRQVIVNLWSAGDLAGADEAIGLAIEHWPQHPQIWRTRLAYLMYSGHPSKALELVRNKSEQPTGTAKELIQALEATAAALASGNGTAHAVNRNLALVSSDPTAVFIATHALAALGDGTSALALLDGYYFGEGEWAKLAPAGGDQDRITGPLFQPPMRNLWGDAGFDRLLKRIGLDDYWRASRTEPDFRRIV